MNIQSKFKKTNTIYKITKDMDLEGSTLIIPVGCTLDFQGGSFKNGTIEGNGTRIINSDNRYIFKDNLSTSGGFDIEELDIKWFGAKSDYSNGTGTDCSPAIERALEWSQYFYGIYIGIHGSFYLGTPIVTNKDLNLRGDRVPGKILFTEAAGNPNQNITSTIYVKPGIKAFTLKGFGDTAKLIKFNLEGIKFTSAWGISDDNTEWIGANTVLISSDTIGGPSRPGSIIGCTISNFYRVLELDSSKINKETQFYNLDIRRNSIDKCGTIFYSRTYGAQKGSGLITIENNILEQSVSVFDMSKIFGYIKICSNLLENSGNSSITLANPGNIDLIGNYWEAMHGDFSITGTDYSSVVRILQNSGGYIQASPSSQYRIILREVTLLDYDLYNMGDVTLRGVIHKVSPRIRLADIPVKTYINCAVHIPIQSVNFINPSDTFKDPKYHYASRSYIENGAINEPLVKSAFIPNSTFQNVGSIKGKLNDFVYVSFYKNAGPLTIAIYTDGGIKAGYDIATAWESGYCFIVTEINQNVGSSDSNIYVVPYNTNTQMDVQISNVNIVNLTSASIYDYNIGDIVVTTNSNGSLTNKVIQVSDVNAINFLNNNLLTGYTLNIVKDIDLQGNSIKIPANVTLDFQGGSISNGTIIGNETKIEGNVKIKCFLSGTYKGNIDGCWFIHDAADNTDELQNFFNLLSANNIGFFSRKVDVKISSAISVKSNTSVDFENCFIYQLSNSAVLANEARSTTYDNINISISNLHMYNTTTNVISMGAIIMRGVKNLKIENFYYTSNVTPPDPKTRNWALTISGIDIYMNNINIDNYITGIWSDGIHFEYVKDLILTNFNIKSGDDCIAINPQDTADKLGGYLPNVNSNIVISNGICASNKGNILRIGAGGDTISPDYYVENVTVNNITVTGEGTNPLISLQDFRTVVPNNLNNNILVSNIKGAANATGNTKTIAIEGTYLPAIDYVWNNIVFENLNLTTEGTGTRIRVYNTVGIVFKDCTINLKGDTEINPYKILSRSTKSLTFKGCTISSNQNTGRIIRLSNNYEVSINDCNIFNYNETNTSIAIDIADISETNQFSESASNRTLKIQDCIIKGVGSTLQMPTDDIILFGIGQFKDNILIDAPNAVSTILNHFNDLNCGIKDIILLANTLPAITSVKGLRLGTYTYDLNLHRPKFAGVNTDNTITYYDAYGYTYGKVKGSTDQRPSLTNTDAGFQFYDNVLKKTILWNGTAWTNLDGTALT